MARIPVANVAERQTAPITGRSLQSRTGNPGVGEALSRVGAGLSQAAELEDRRLEELDRAAAKEADNAYLEFENETLQTGEGAYFTMKGGNAVRGRNDAEEALKARYQEILKSATNERQRQYIKDVVGRRHRNGLTSVGAYAAREAEAYSRQQSLSRISLSQQEGLLKRYSREDRERAKNTGLSEINEMAAAQGWDPETTELARLEYTTKFYEGIVIAAADDNPQAAMSLLTAKKDEIDPARYADLKEKLEAPVIDQWADGRADEMRGVGPGGVENMADLPDLESMLAKVDRMNLSREKEKALKAALMSKAATDQQLLANKERRANRIATDWMTAQGAGFVDAKTVPKAIWFSASPSMRQTLANTANANKTGVKFKTDPATYLALSGMSDAELKDINLLEYTDKLSEADFKFFAKAQGDETGVVHSKNQTLTGMTNSALVAMGIDPSVTKNNKDIEAATEFRQRVQVAVEAEEKARGKTLEPTEMQSVINLMTREIVVNPTGWFNKKTRRVFEVDASDPEIPVPDHMVDMIDIRLRQMGEEPDDKKRSALYFQMLIDGGLDERAAAGELAVDAYQGFF